MSGLTYGPDSGANGAEYGSYVADGSRPVSYVAQLGQPQPGMLPPGMMQHDQMAVMGAQQGGYLNPTMGEPTMRESVEGIPQVHGQQQQQQQQQQQHYGGMPALQGINGAMPGIPQHLAAAAVMQPQAYTMPQGMTMAQQYAAVEYYRMAHAGGPPYGAQMATLLPDGRLATNMPQYMHGAAGAEWEEEYDDSSQAVLYGNLEVKHRRRTSPEQLRVLEHYFAINPRPDNAMREHLASQLGITKRNVQVWFQNRRAKIKTREKEQREKEEKARLAAAEKEQAKVGDQSKLASEAGDAPSQTENKTPTPDVKKESSQGGDRAGSTAAPSGQDTPVATQQPQVPSIGVQQLPPQPPPPAIQSQAPPSRPLSSTGTADPQATNLVPNAAKIDMGRRVSIAGGDTAYIEQWAIKRRQQMHQGAGSSPYPANLSPANSPMGLAAAARRNSQPYPTQLLTHHVGGATGSGAVGAADDGSASRSALGSPKISPNATNGRTPSHLLFTAMRNNTIRRASIPGGGAQLISTTAFTPPRVSTAYHTSSSDSPSAGRGASGIARELSPIKDQDYEIDPALRQVPMTFVTPPQNGSNDYNPPGSADSASALQYALNPGLPFSPNSPLPNPTFSFGGAPSHDASATPSAIGDKSPSGLPPMDDPNHALFMALQRGRLGSIASVNSTATNGTDATEFGSEAEWGSFLPPGFDPDIRRASAPADLLHNIGLLGISGPTSQNPSPIRPSPLASGGMPANMMAGGGGSGQGSVPTYELNVPAPMRGPMSAPLQQSSSATLGGGPYLPAASMSPTHSAGGSQMTSEGPSPVGTQLQINPQNLMMPPPPLPGQPHLSHQQQQQHYHNHQHHQLQFAPLGQGQGYAAESSAVLPPSFPNVPDPSAYSMASSSVSSNSDAGLGNSSTNPTGIGGGGGAGEFDLSFEFATDSDDKDFSFLSDLTNGDASDAVNVFV